MTGNGRMEHPVHNGDPERRTPCSIPGPQQPYGSHITVFYMNSCLEKKMYLKKIADCSETLFIFKSENIVELNMNLSAAFFFHLKPKYLQTQESKQKVNFY